MYSEMILFLQSIMTGLVLYLVYDLIIAFRKVIPHPLILISCGDMLYWVTTGFVVFVCLYRTNQGILRSFLFLGIILGAWFGYLVIRPVYEKVWIILFRIPVFFVKKTINRLLFFIKRCNIFLYHFVIMGKVCGKIVIQWLKRGRQFEKSRKNNQ